MREEAPDASCPPTAAPDCCTATAAIATTTETASAVGAVGVEMMMGAGVGVREKREGVAWQMRRWDGCTL